MPRQQPYQKTAPLAASSPARYPRFMLKVVLVAAWMAVLISNGALAQKLQLTPTTPGSPAPVWQRMVQLDDGRIFVTDGGMAIDAALVKPTLPNSAPVSGKIIERYLS